KAMRCAPRSRPNPAAHLQRPVCRTVTDNISPDPGDRLHTAACIHGDVDVLLTRNLKHFRAPAISDAGVQVMISDTFPAGLLSRRRQAVVASFTRAASRNKNPPTTPAELAD